MIQRYKVLFTNLQNVPEVLTEEDRLVDELHDFKDVARAVKEGREGPYQAFASFFFYMPNGNNTYAFVEEHEIGKFYDYFR
ncbi:hypothetical protein [Shouchella shacheensis]|uniref:hypothetical protein n=1 Tax=Shouchella shacheensis TaxID=1649580 RepID=UPI00073FB51C|nr:hypothetical protein [Shouchella shacheensis]